MTNKPKYEQPQSLIAEYLALYSDNPALAEQMALQDHVRQKREGRGWRTDNYKNRRDERENH